MTIRRADIDVVHVHADDMFFTIVESYRNHDGLKPVYTMLCEDAHGSPIKVQSNLHAEEINKTFDYDVIGLLHDH